MNGRCDNDPLDRADNVCDKCGGDYCDACLLYPRGKKRAPVCKACAIAASGIRSTSKSTTPQERKQVRKRRKELQQAEEIEDNQGFIFFDEEGSDIVMRDPSVLEPEEEEAPARRFGKKSKTKSKSTPKDKAEPAKAEKAAKKDKKLKKLKKAAAADAGSAESGDEAETEEHVNAIAGAAASDMPPPPAAEDAVIDDEEETIDLGMALASYDSSDDDEQIDSIEESTNDTSLVDKLNGTDDAPASISLTEAPVAETPVAGGGSPSASELLARLKEAESSRAADLPVDDAHEEPELQAPTPSSAPTASSIGDGAFDATVNPFADEPLAREPMEAWVPPPVTPDPEPAALAESSFLNEQPFATEHSGSFAHDPAFEDDRFDANDFAHEPAFDNAVDDEPNWSSNPLEVVIHAPEVDADAEPALADMATDSPFGSGPSSDTGSVATATKADTDEDGNWVPPALRGMLPKEERDNDAPLPRRRDDD